MIRTNVNYDFPLSLQAGEALSAGHLVKLDSDGRVAHAGAGDFPIGWVEYDASDLDAVAVEKLEGKLQLMAGGSISVGNYVKAGASGHVVVEASATTPTAFTIGQALTAGSNGNLMYVLACK